MEEMNKEEMAIREDASLVDITRVLQGEIVQRVLRALIVVGFIGAVAGTYYDYVNQNLYTIPIYWTVYAFILVVALWKRIPYAVRAWTIVTAFYGMAVLDFITDGRGGSGRVLLVIVPFAAALFLGRRESVVASIVVFCTMAVFGWIYSTGRLTVPLLDSSNPTGWVSNTAIMLMTIAFSVTSLNYLTPRLIAALTQSQQLSQELEKNQARLEGQVAERTSALERRSAQLEAAAQVAREAAEIRDVERLLERMVHLVSDRFGFYHTGIFLTDESYEYAVLRAASSEGGRRMLERGHRLRVGQVGIVGYVTGRGEPRVALDVGEDAVYFDNPDMPETHSEMALPLRVRGNITGALDVQSKKPEAFTQEDVTVLQTLADQVAVAIENARLLAESQAALEATRRAYGEISREAWRELLHTQSELGARYDPRSILPSDERQGEGMKLALREGKPISDADGRSNMLAVPLKVRGQVIGMLNAHKPGDGGEWTPEEVALMETLTEQLGVALESARLYQDTQRRAQRERLTSDITDKMRRAPGVERIIQTALDELSENLGASRAFIQLGTTPIAAEKADGGKKVSG
ncbi:MAG: GAF domain-containing protein [Chloroflexota bacterium]|nr:GAF domain-containing protein [Chloroflexota bacterium]